MEKSKVTDYVIAEARTATGLESKVGEYILIGYTPIGGVAITAVANSYNIEYFYCQALIKEE